MLFDDTSLGLNGDLLEFGSDGQSTRRRTTANAPESEPSGRVTSKKLLKKLECQDWKCALSGVELTPEAASLDHKKPLTDGGGDDMVNVQIVHVTINTMKGTMGEKEFVWWCQLVAAVAAGKKQS